MLHICGLSAWRDNHTMIINENQEVPERYADITNLKSYGNAFLINDTNKTKLNNCKYINNVFEKMQII